MKPDDNCPDLLLWRRKFAIDICIWVILFVSSLSQQELDFLPCPLRLTGLSLKREMSTHHLHRIKSPCMESSVSVTVFTWKQKQKWVYEVLRVRVAEGPRPHGSHANRLEGEKGGGKGNPVSGGELSGRSLIRYQGARLLIDLKRKVK